MNQAFSNGPLRVIQVDRRRISLHSGVFLMLICLGQYVVASQNRSAHGADDAARWTFNFPHTPLVLKATSEKSYSLTNVGHIGIVKYRLGCIRFGPKKDRVIVHRMEIEEIEILPGKTWGVQGFDTRPDRIECEKKDAKLSVIDVFFRDGNEWHASESEARSTQACIFGRCSKTMLSASERA